MKTDSGPPMAAARMAEREFVAMMAMLVALTALSIDIMLPALPAISDAYGLTGANDRQAVVVAYVLGFGLGQPFFGPLTDRFGRLPLLTIALALTFATSLAAAWAPDYSMLLAARFAQGLGGAGTRVVAIAVVRDRFGGRDMARVMSLVMSVFVIIPVVAPSIGGLLVHIGHWQWTFHATGLVAAALLVWAALRLGESLRPEHRRPLSPGPIVSAMAGVARHRFTLGFATAQGFLFGAIFAYLSTAQQIFGEIYGLGDLFPLVFAAVVVGLVIANLANSRLVGRLGMRPISRAAVYGYIAVGALHVAIAWFGNPPLWLFSTLLGAGFFMFGMMMPNLNALAMEPHAGVAGTASAWLGFYTTMIGAVLGGFIGSFLGETVFPLVLGILLIGIATRLAMLYSEAVADDIITAPRV